MTTITKPITICTASVLFTAFVLCPVASSQSLTLLSQPVRRTKKNTLLSNTKHKHSPIHPSIHPHFVLCISTPFPSSFFFFGRVFFSHLFARLTDHHCIAFTSHYISLFFFSFFFLLLRLFSQQLNPVANPYVLCSCSSPLVLAYRSDKPPPLKQKKKRVGCVASEKREKQRKS